jgi:hypothetical protein
MAISIITLTKKNKFGHRTHYIQLDTLHRVEINETTNGTYIVEFFELGLIWNTPLFSFTSSNHIYDIVSESMDRVANYYRRSDKYDVPEYLFVKDKQQAMAQAYSQFGR